MAGRACTGWHPPLYSTYTELRASWLCPVAAAATQQQQVWLLRYSTLLCQAEQLHNPTLHGKLSTHFLTAFAVAVRLFCCRIAWGVTFITGLFKPRRERTYGSMRDLLYICLLFVALKLDGLAAFTWSVVFLIPWMWFGALFVGAVVVSVSKYACSSASGCRHHVASAR